MSNGALELDKHNDFSAVKLPHSLDPVACKGFEEKLPELFGNHAVISCGNHTFMPKDWLRAIIKLHLHLKSEGKALKLIQVNPVLLNYLRKEGMDSILGICKDLNEALSELGCGTGNSTMDTEFIDSFVTAAVHVLKVQASVDAKLGKSFLKKSTDVISGDVSGIIGVVSDTFNGSVVITFPESTFLKVMSNMLGENYTKITQDIVDGAGELTNIIFGQAKIALNDKGYGIKTAIPSVVAGKNQMRSSQGRGSVIVVPFESSVGQFFLEICVG